MSGGSPPGASYAKCPPLLQPARRADDENKAPPVANKVDYGPGRHYPLGSAGSPRSPLIARQCPRLCPTRFSPISTGWASRIPRYPTRRSLPWTNRSPCVGEILGGHNKNLFLKDRFGALYLVVLLEDARINLKTLPGILDCGRISFGSADLLREVLGVEPGSVTPLR